ncbi:MAG: hypothetical protein Q8N42_00390 [bacterium]|nr:hypothetical protein [bacterium]
MPKEEIGDKEEKQQKKSAKVEMPAYIVPTEKEAKEKKGWLKEKFDQWREQL